MNGYLCHWLYGKEPVEVYTDKGAYDAQRKAAEIFQKSTRKKVKSWDIKVYLAEKSGEPVIHSTTEFG